MQETVPPRGLKPIPVRHLLWAFIGSALAVTGGVFGVWGALSPSVLVDVGDHLVLARIISGVIGASLPLLGLLGVHAVLTGGNRTPRYVADQEGPAIWCGKGSAEVGWDQLVAVGLSFKVSPRWRPTGPLWRPHEAQAPELYVRAPDPLTVCPRAKLLLITEPPPHPDLPPVRLRMVYGSLLSGESIEADLGPRLGQRWLGTYQRAWRRMPGF